MGEEGVGKDERPRDGELLTEDADENKVEKMEPLPKSDAPRVDVTGDGGVVKQTTREGDPEGDFPPKSSMCFGVHSRPPPRHLPPRLP